MAEADPVIVEQDLETARPARRRWGRVALMAFLPLALLVGAGLYWLSLQGKVATDNAYVKQDMVAVSAEVGGRIIAVMVQEGDEVKAGDVLFRIDPEPFELEMARGTFGTVVIADLDNLKAVNDAFGHAAGDRLLRQCADLLRSTLRPYDKLYRWGGDEFLLVIPSARGTDVEARLGEVLKTAEPIEVAHGQKTVKLEVSLGAADYTSAEGLEDSIQLADEAMYRQKHARKSPVHGLREADAVGRGLAVVHVPEAVLDDLAPGAPQRQLETRVSRRDGQREPARDVLQPHERDPVVVARARERRDLGDPRPIEDGGGARRPRMARIAHQALPVDDEAGMQPAHAADENKKGCRPGGVGRQPPICPSGEARPGSKRPSSKH